MPGDGARLTDDPGGLAATGLVSPPAWLSQYLQFIFTILHSFALKITVF
jgi:hypothetical protein